MHTRRNCAAFTLILLTNKLNKLKQLYPYHFISSLTWLPYLPNLTIGSTLYIASNMSWYFIVFKRMPDSFNHDVHMTGFYTNISSSFMPCTINKKGPYFVTVHTGCFFNSPPLKSIIKYIKFRLSRLPLPLKVSDYIVNLIGKVLSVRVYLLELVNIHTGGVHIAMALFFSAKCHLTNTLMDTSRVHINHIQKIFRTSLGVPTT